MTKEEILNNGKHFFKDQLNGWFVEGTLSAMQEYADIQSEKKAIAFCNWRNEYVNELTHEYMIYTKGSEPAILVNDEIELYQYWFNNIYNKP